MKFERMEQVSGYPILQHWAHEWKSLYERLGTRLTQYTYYFDNVIEARAGIMGQYWQRMREIYLSAYLRTLAYSVTKWRIPIEIAEDYSLDLVHGIAGLFDVEPSVRPAWLSDFPERFCSSGADFKLLVNKLVKAAGSAGMMLASIDAPIAWSLHKYAKITLSAHLVTPDFEMADDASLQEKSLLLQLGDTFNIEVPIPKETVQQAMTEGKKGNEVALCRRLFPMPFGCWQSDYFSLGLRIAAPYTIPNLEIRCSSESIDCIAPMRS